MVNFDDFDLDVQKIIGGVGYSATNGGGSDFGFCKGDTDTGGGGTPSDPVSDNCPTGTSCTLKPSCMWCDTITLAFC